MDEMKKSRFGFLKRKWFLVTAAILLVLIILVVTRSSAKKANFEYATAAVGNVIEQVGVTGTVSPVDKANLAFEKGGVITNVYVKVGDTVNAGDRIASLDSANDEAALVSAQATLADMSRSLTPAEQDVQVTSLSNAVLSAYASAQGALVNYTDPFFTNPQSANPVLNIRTDSPDVGYRLNNERAAVSDALNRWAMDISSSTDVITMAADSNGFLATIKNFFNDLGITVNELNPGNSGLTQSVINADVTAMNSAITSLNSAISSVSTAQSNYNLKLAGNSSDSIAAQAAKVAQAQAQLDQDTLLSPIDGIVTQADPTVGEYISPGGAGFAVQNSGFKVEAYVAEADIAKVAVGDLASSTLDAYGAYVDFPEKVVSIDPAETVLEGVPTYKVTLQFVSPDSRIRSGMTSNLEILTHQSDNVLAIPYRAVIMTATSTTVRVVSADGKTYSSVPVTTGLKGSDGTIEITSGLQSGDKVVTYVGA
jgi:HlyD family secretion protein